MRSINPDVVALMKTIEESGVPALGSQPPSVARESYAASRKNLQPVFDPVAEVIDLSIPGDAPDATIPARLFRGSDAQAAPCLLFLHGGGWVLGDLDSHEGICRRIASQARCSVLAVDYRLAPEHPFPAAVDDSAAALRWMAANARDLRIDPERIAVGGDSAGGNLSAVIALMARDKAVPPICYQLLLYPATDLTMTSESYERATQKLVLTPDSMRYFIGHYLQDIAQGEDWRASPLRAASLAGTAPAFVLTCGHDPLCAEGRLYAERLEREGVPVSALHMSDQAHGILTLGGMIAATTPLLDFAASLLSETWQRIETSRTVQAKT